MTSSHFLLNESFQFERHRLWFIEEGTTTKTIRLIERTLSLSLAGSVTRWLNYFSIFGLLQQWKLSPIMSQICQSRLGILPNKKYTVKNLPKTVAQSSENSLNLVTLVACQSKWWRYLTRRQQTLHFIVTSFQPFSFLTLRSSGEIENRSSTDLTEFW